MDTVLNLVAQAVLTWGEKSKHGSNPILFYEYSQKTHPDGHAVVNNCTYNNTKYAAVLLVCSPYSTVMPMHRRTSYVCHSQNNGQIGNKYAPSRLAVHAVMRTRSACIVSPPSKRNCVSPSVNVHTSSTDLYVTNRP